MSRVPLCIIGNSHTVAIKDGWSLAGEVTQAFEPTYFAAANNGFSELEIRGDTLAAGTEKTAELMTTFCGTAQIPVAPYSAFLLVGLSASILCLAQIYDRHRLAAHAGREYQIVSPAVLREAVREATRASLAFQILKNLRKLTTAPIVVVGEPLLSTYVLDKKDTDPFWSENFVAELCEIYRREAPEAAAQYQTDLVLQPADTIVQGAFTDSEYSVGARKLWAGQKAYDDREHRHMNGAFGARMLEIALPLLQRKLEEQAAHQNQDIRRTPVGAL